MKSLIVLEVYFLHQNARNISPNISSDRLHDKDLIIRCVGRFKAKVGQPDFWTVGGGTVGIPSPCKTFANLL